MAKYDDLTKRLGRLRPKDFVQWLCPNLGIEEVSFEDREFELTHRSVDILYKVKTVNIGEFYFHLEFQAQLKQGFSMRLHEYSVRIWREFKLPVKTIVVFLESTQAIEELVPVERCEFAGELISEFRYIKIILSNEDWRDILAKGFPALLALIPLTRIAKGEEQEVLGKAAQAIEDLEDKELRGELAAIFYLVGGYKYPKAVRQVIGEKLMQDLMESATYRETVERERRANIVKVLKARFRVVFEEIMESLNSVASATDLDVLLEKAATVRDVKGFKKALAEIAKK